MTIYLYLHYSEVAEFIFSRSFYTGDAELNAFTFTCIIGTLALWEKTEERERERDRERDRERRNNYRHTHRQKSVKSTQEPSF